MKMLLGVQLPETSKACFTQHATSSAWIGATHQQVDERGKLI
jgi:hypothetical protein